LRELDASISVSVSAASNESNAVVSERRDADMDQIASELQRELRQTVDRLKDLGGDRYGTCQICGTGIAAARLRAIPEATTCVRCQEIQEGVRS
jgi:RNA polymerase-binding transcription factor